MDLMKLLSRYMRPLFKCLTVGLLIAITVLSVVPPEYRLETGAPHDIEHAAIFLLFGVSMVLGYRMRFWAWVTSGPLFTAIIEVAQLGVPGRHARLSDFLVDAGAVLLGSACAVLLLKIRRIGAPREVISTLQ